MKKVLIVEAFIPHYRVPFFQSLHGALSKENVALRVAYGQQSRNDRHESYGARHDLPFGVRTRNVWLFKARILLQPVLREIMRADLVIVEQANKHLMNYLLLVLSLLGIKKLAFWGHGWNRQRSSPHSLSERVKARLVRFPSWWFAYTSGTARYLESNGVPAGVITVVQNSVDVRCFADQLSRVTDPALARARSDLGIPLEARVGLFCGRLHKDKKVDFLLRAAAAVRGRVPHFHLIVIGDGPEKKAVASFAEKESWVHYVGARVGMEKALYFRLAHLVLNPGLIGLGILDAFAAGLPIITTDLPIHSPEIEYFENGRNGLMCRPVVSDFADAVTDVFFDGSLSGRLAAGALESAGRYSLEAMVENFKSGILNCLGPAN